MTLVDLFCGCGGFSSGAHAVGAAPAVAFDIDENLTSSYKYNFPNTELVLTDLAYVGGAQIKRRVGKRIDGVFGGPPCQGFSSIGRRLPDDPRRQLLWHFFRLVSEIKPKFFIMENVQGLLFSDARHELDEAIELVRKRFEILGPIVLDAADFGAATKRRRLFVIGYDRRYCDPITEADFDALKVSPTNIRAAIGDLVSAKYLYDDDGFDIWKLQNSGRASQYAASLRAPERLVTGHKRTYHTPEVVRRFRKILPGEFDSVGRHPRLSWTGQCPTLRAGTGSDKGSFQSVRPIHPDEPRVITVREAARIQGFSDTFRFHPTIWHSFRMIGNSVSPVIARAIFSVVAKRTDLEKRYLEAAE